MRADLREQPRPSGALELQRLVDERDVCAPLCVGLKARRQGVLDLENIRCGERPDHGRGDHRATGSHPAGRSPGAITSERISPSGDGTRTSSSCSFTPGDPARDATPPSGRRAHAGGRQVTTTSVTSPAAITPVPFETVQTCTGLPGWVFTRTSQLLPPNSSGNRNVKGPSAFAPQRRGKGPADQLQDQAGTHQPGDGPAHGEARAGPEVLQGVGLGDGHRLGDVQREPRLRSGSVPAGCRARAGVPEVGYPFHCQARRVVSCRRVACSTRGRTPNCGRGSRTTRRAWVRVR